MKNMWAPIVVALLLMNSVGVTARSQVVNVAQVTDAAPALRPAIPPVIDPEAAAVETTTNSDSLSSNEPPAFKDKHPKIHKTYRGARWFCIKTEPFVRYAAHVFQILTPFILEAF